MSSATEIQTFTKTIALMTFDGQLFDVDETVAMELKIVKSFFEENSDASSNVTVPLHNVHSKQLAKIIAYCKARLGFRLRGESAKDEAKSYNVEFMKKQTNKGLKELILATNYLDVKELMDVLSDEIADRIKNKSVEYVRKFFSIENDYTPEEEEKVRNENAWAFEGVDPDLYEEEEEEEEEEETQFIHKYCKSKSKIL